ncbi:glycoside hydrolase family 73 protein [Chitinophaga sp. LS1]|uniref:glycoside hydrolase family 73 protein n=1 Tax=Chitinophaga sp. LS1 TaxID=3051176 RepID=UPI002AAB3B9B|nr:glucosaminidase domain-containing protein [Chitinophaga sp. LS1]WPV66270.1 glucosaminidase domain-containing protein [Chitinophaga sp. LS1]
MEKQTFFKLYYPAAVLCERETKIPALAILAQAALESGWGDKAPGNMFFGIKAGVTWRGKRQLITTREVHSTKTVKYPEIISITPRTDGKFDYKVKDWFRAYDNAAESFIDHGKFILENPRYKNAIGISDPGRFVEVVAAAGYATDPNYAKTLKSIINGLAEYLPKRE